LGEAEPRPRRKFTPTSVVTVIAILVFVAIFAAITIGLVVNLF
jgi:hypothetical protein